MLRVLFCVAKWSAGGLGCAVYPRLRREAGAVERMAVRLVAQTRSARRDRHRMLRGHFGGNPPKRLTVTQPFLTCRQSSKIILHMHCTRR